MAGLLGLAGLLVHGYHPWAEDAGIYVPAVKKLLDPTLYGFGSDFFMLPARFSIFTHVVGLSVRVTHLRLPYVLLAWYVICLTVFISASWQVAEVCLKSREAALWASALLTACLTMPAAGSGLLLYDPYLTARSFSTALGMLAVAAALKKKYALGALACVGAGLFHPLMAAIYVVFIALLLLLSAGRKPITVGLLLLAGATVILAGASSWSSVPSESYRAAVMTRSYFFLSRWKWYEIGGAFAPLIIFAGTAWLSVRQARLELFRASVAVVMLGVVALLLGAWVTWFPSLLSAARFQPLRTFQVIYVMLFILPLTLMVRSLTKGRAAAGALGIVMVASIMFAAQRQAFPATRHLEWPWADSGNRWERAFGWIRENTPKSAVFALSSNYANEPGADHQSFRACAERSVLADVVKDGGVAALFPTLAPEWNEEITATVHMGDAGKNWQADLLNSGVSWVVLQGGGHEGVVCPYQSGDLRVCALEPVDRGSRSDAVARLRTMGAKARYKSRDRLVPLTRPSGTGGEHQADRTR